MVFIFNLKLDDINKIRKHKFFEKFMKWERPKKTEIKVVKY